VVSLLGRLICKLKEDVMNKFKVGDFVKLESWMDFYEIIDETDVSKNTKHNFSFI